MERYYRSAQKDGVGAKKGGRKEEERRELEQNLRAERESLESQRLQKVAEARNKVEGVKAVMAQNSSHVLDRSEKLESLEQRAADLSAQAAQFSRTAFAIKKEKEEEEEEMNGKVYMVDEDMWGSQDEIYDMVRDDSFESYSSEESKENEEEEGEEEEEEEEGEDVRGLLEQSVLVSIQKLHTIFIFYFILLYTLYIADNYSYLPPY